MIVYNKIKDKERERWRKMILSQIALLLLNYKIILKEAIEEKDKNCIRASVSVLVGQIVLFIYTIYFIMKGGVIDA